MAQPNERSYAVCRAPPAPVCSSWQTLCQASASGPAVTMLTQQPRPSAVPAPSDDPLSWFPKPSCAQSPTSLTWCLRAYPAQQHHLSLLCVTLLLCTWQMPTMSSQVGICNVYGAKWVSWSCCLQEAAVLAVEVMTFSVVLSCWTTAQYDHIQCFCGCTAVCLDSMHKKLYLRLLKLIDLGLE